MARARGCGPHRTGPCWPELMYCALMGDAPGQEGFGLCAAAVRGAVGAGRVTTGAATGAAGRAGAVVAATGAGAGVRTTTRAVLGAGAVGCEGVACAVRVVARGVGAGSGVAGVAAATGGSTVINSGRPGAVWRGAVRAAAAASADNVGV
ncbi:MAG: hypothetical protein AB3N22_00885 [Ruegeria sp.]